MHRIAKNLPPNESIPLIPCSCGTLYRKRYIYTRIDLYGSSNVGAVHVCGRILCGIYHMETPIFWWPYESPYDISIDILWKMSLYTCNIRTQFAHCPRVIDERAQ